MPERRRGKQLNDALLDAAWAELTEHGYGDLTLESVAARAATSRPVLARRWPSRSSLLKATLSHVLEQHPVTVPDTGSLRSDLIDALGIVNDSGAGLFATVSVHLGAYYDETGTTPSDLHDAVAGGSPEAFAPIFTRAVARGEADPARLTDRIRALPFDLIRQELFRFLRPVPDQTIREIVDDIVMPLVRPAKGPLPAAREPGRSRRRPGRVE